MTQQIIDVGDAINDGTGDPARTAFTKCNDNFTELYATPTWTTYSPGIVSASGTLTSASATGKYLTIGKLTHVQIDITITTNGSGASFLATNLPHTPVGAVVFTGREIAVNGKACIGSWFADAAILIVNYDATYPGADGVNIIMSGTYENL